jgi:hypothetical protein
VPGIPVAALFLRRRQSTREERTGTQKQIKAASQASERGLHLSSGVVFLCL